MNLNERINELLREALTKDTSEAEGPSTEHHLFDAMVKLADEARQEKVPRINELQSQVLELSAQVQLLAGALHDTPRSACPDSLAWDFAEFVLKGEEDPELRRYAIMNDESHDWAVPMEYENLWDEWIGSDEWELGALPEGISEDEVIRIDGTFTFVLPRCSTQG